MKGELEEGGLKMFEKKYTKKTFFLLASHDMMQEYESQTNDKHTSGASATI